MICKACGPSILLGVIGLVTGLVGVLGDQSILAAVAGIFALGAGWTGVKLGQQLSRTQDRHNLVAKELAEVSQGAELAGRQLEDFKAEAVNHLSDEFSPEPTKQGEPNALLDTQTGLFSENFFRVALESRIASARRHLRPISVILLTVASEGSTVELDPIAKALRETIRDADTACQMDTGEFALVLEDTPETGAIWTVERVRRRLATLDESLILWAGLACYPAHAFSRDAIIEAASRALVRAKDWEQGRIEVSETVEEA